MICWTCCGAGFFVAAAVFGFGVGNAATVPLGDVAGALGLISGAAVEVDAAFAGVAVEVAVAGVALADAAVAGLALEADAAAGVALGFAPPLVPLP